MFNYALYTCSLHDALPIWIQAEVGIADGLFDARQRARVEGLHGDELGLGRVHLGDLVERHLRAVVLDAHRIKHVDRRPSEIGEHTSELQSLAYLVCRLLLE